MAASVVDGLSVVKFDGAVSMEPPKYTRVSQSCRSLLSGTARFTFEGPAAGVANIRIEGDNWSEATLIVGDKRFASLHTPRYGNSFFLTDGGNCLPLVEGTPVTLSIKKESSDDLYITYDYVDCNFTEGDFAFRYFQTTGPDTASAGDAKVLAGFIWPVEKIIVDVLKGRVDAMQFCCCAAETVTFPFQKVSDTQFVLDFDGKAVDFTKLTRQRIQFVATEETVVNARAVTVNIARVHSGSYDLKYCR